MATETTIMITARNDLRENMALVLGVEEKQFSIRAGLKIMVTRNY